MFCFSYQMKKHWKNFEFSIEMQYNILDFVCR